jgi:hypothetical protein
MMMMVMVIVVGAVLIGREIAGRPGASERLLLQLPLLLVLLELWVLPVMLGMLEVLLLLLLLVLVLGCRGGGVEHSRTQDGDIAPRVRLVVIYAEQAGGIAAAAAAASELVGDHRDGESVDTKVLTPAAATTEDPRASTPTHTSAPPAAPLAAATAPHVLGYVEIVEAEAAEGVGGGGGGVVAVRQRGCKVLAKVAVAQQAIDHGQTGPARTVPHAAEGRRRERGFVPRLSRGRASIGAAVAL